MNEMLSVPGSNNRDYCSWAFREQVFGLCSLDPQLPRQFANLHKGRIVCGQSDSERRPKQVLPRDFTLFGNYRYR